MLIKEISEHRLSFFIISDIKSFDHPANLFSELSKVEYTETKEWIRLLDYTSYETEKKHRSISGYLGIFKRNLILKDSNLIGINSENYIAELSKLFPDKLITAVVKIQIEGDESVTGGIIKSYRNNKEILHIRKTGTGNNDILFDAEETYIKKEDQSSGLELNKEEILKLINKILCKILSSKSLKRIRLKRLEQIKFNQIDQNKFKAAIINNFPNVSNIEIAPAEMGRELRAMLSEDKKVELFPNKKELQLILCKTTMKAFSHIQFEHKKTYNQLKVNNAQYEDTIGFYYVRGQFDVTYKRRFLEIEKKIKKWAKKHSIPEGDKIDISVYYPLSDIFHTNITFRSYESLALQFYFRLRYLEEIILPEAEKLLKINNLNNRINYGNQNSDRLHGYKRAWKGDNKVIIANPVISILAEDENYEKIIEEEVLRYLADESDKINYIDAFNDLRIKSA